MVHRKEGAAAEYVRLTTEEKNLIETNKEVKSAVEKIVEARDKVMKRINEDFKKVTDAKLNIAARLEEKRDKEAKMIRARQELAVGEAYQKAIKKLCQLVAKGEDVDETLTEVLAEAEDEGQESFRLYRLRFQNTLAEEGVTIETVKRLEQGMETVKNLEKTAPDLVAVYKKILERHELTEADYNNLAAHINPAELNAGPQDTVEASTTGLIIGSMNETQREEFIEKLMTSDKKMHTGPLVDQLLTLGVLKKETAKKLLEKAVDKGAISRDQYNTLFLPRLEGFHYEEEQKKRKSQFEKAVKSELGKISLRNYTDRYFSEGMFLNDLGFLWGATTFTLNTLAQKGKFWKSPWAIAGAVAMGVTGKNTLRRFGYDIPEIVREVDETTATKKLKEVLVSNHRKAPKTLRDYLMTGGIETLLKLYKKKPDNVRPEDHLTLEKLKEEEGPAFKAMVDAIENDPSLSGDPEIRKSQIFEHLFKIAEGSNALKVKDLAKYKETVEPESTA